MKSFEPLTDHQINELMKLRLGDPYPVWVQEYIPSGCSNLEHILLGTLLYYRNLLWDAEDKLDEVRKDR